MPQVRHVHPLGGPEQPSPSHSDVKKGGRKEEIAAGKRGYLFSSDKALPDLWVPLAMLSLFKYLCSVLTASVNEWPAVI